jgi:hypothetical protein
MPSSNRDITDIHINNKRVDVMASETVEQLPEKIPTNSSLAARLKPSFKQTYYQTATITC